MIPISKTADKNSPLLAIACLRAVQTQDLTIVKFLLVKKIGLHGKFQGASPLVIACQNHSGSLAQLLLQEPDISQTEMYNGWAAIHYALATPKKTKFGGVTSDETLNFMIQEKANLNLKTVDQKSSLLVLIMSNMSTTAIYEQSQKLLENGVDPNEPVILHF